MPSVGEIRGEVLQGETPNWGPLLGFASHHVDEFMWMFEVVVDDGRQIQAYKHRWTRRYLHLDQSGRAYVFSGDGRYREVEAGRLLQRVLESDVPG